MVLMTASPVMNAYASVGVPNKGVVASGASKPAGSVPEAFAMAARADLAAASLRNMIAMVSYQAPTNALPSFGLAARVAVFTTIKSMISPGILLESKTNCAFGDVNTELSWGFHVTNAEVVGAANAPTMSASEVLTDRK